MDFDPKAFQAPRHNEPANGHNDQIFQQSQVLKLERMAPQVKRASEEVAWLSSIVFDAPANEPERLFLPSQHNLAQTDYCPPCDTNADNRIPSNSQAMSHYKRRDALLSSYPLLSLLLDLADREAPEPQDVASKTVSWLTGRYVDAADGVPKTKLMPTPPRDTPETAIAQPVVKEFAIAEESESALMQRRRLAQTQPKRMSKLRLYPALLASAGVAIACFPPRSEPRTSSNDVRDLKEHRQLVEDEIFSRLRRLRTNDAHPEQRTVMTRRRESQNSKSCL